MGWYQCGVCGRGVGANSVLCTACGKWCHRRCSGLKSLIPVAMAHFQGPACARRVAGGAVGVGAGVVGEVKQFYNLMDVFDCGRGAERAIRARVGSAWSNWREISAYW